MSMAVIILEADDYFGVLDDSSHTVVFYRVTSQGVPQLVEPTEQLPPKDFTPDMHSERVCAQDVISMVRAVRQRVVEDQVALARTPGNDSYQDGVASGLSMATGRLDYLLTHWDSPNFQPGP